MAGKICVNNAVVDKYMKGTRLNDAISEVFYGEIQDKINDNEAFAKMTPMQMVMHDAGINSNSEVGKILDASSTYTSGGGFDNNEWLFPVWLEETIREPIYEKNIIGEIVNTTIGIEGNIVKSPTLDLLSKENKPNMWKARIAEGADIPIAHITMGEQAISLYKYGRAIELTYEAMRRMKVKIFIQHINAIINDIAGQNLDRATDILVNGDGNANTQATQIGTTENPGSIENDELIGFLVDYWFENHYTADTIVTSKDMFKKISAMFYDMNLRNGASSGVSFRTPQFMPNQTITLLAANLPKIGAGKDAIILLNKANTLVRYEENASNIQENQKNIRNQTNLLTVTENSGYAISVIGSNKYIEVL